MSLNEEKNQSVPQKNKTRLALLGLLAALLALGGGALAYHIHQVNVQQADLVLWDLLTTSGDAYDEAKYAEWQADFAAIRDKGAFKSELRRGFRNLADVGLANTQTYYDGFGSRVEDMFGNEGGCTECSHIYYEAIGVLAREGYEDPELKDIALNYYQRERALYEKNVDMITEKNPPLGLASRFNAAAVYMDHWNEAGGDFYALDMSQVYTPADVRDSYANAIQDCVENRNLDRLTILLVDTSTSPLMRDEPFFTTQEILDIYTGGTQEVYTLLNGVGGYYSGGANEYGDFYYSSTSHRRGGKTFDMTEFNANPGLWNAIGQDLQRYITDTNRRANQTVHDVDFRIRDLETPRGFDVPEMVKEGFGYAIPYEGREGLDFIFVSPDAMALNGGLGVKKTLYGDYSDLYNQLKEEYESAVSAAPELLAPYADYTGVFTSQKRSTWVFTSGFTVAGGTVRWNPSPAPGKDALPFQLRYKRKVYEFLNGLHTVEDMQVTDELTMFDNTRFQTTLTFQDGTILMSISRDGLEIDTDVFTKTN